MQYAFKSSDSVLYLRHGATIRCPFHAMARVDLDNIHYQYPDDLIKERLKLALFEQCKDKHITIERDEDSMTVYTTSDTSSPLYRGCILRWTSSRS
jgi:hypothetical protein